MAKLVLLLDRLNMVLSPGFNLLLPVLVLFLLVKPTLQRSVRNVGFPGECSPSPNPAKRQHILGYGSLMKEASKSKSYPNTGTNVPVTVHGFSRLWNALGNSLGFSTTYLGISREEGSSFNGVVFQIPHTEDASLALRSYDEREMWYCRQRVSFDQLSFYPRSPILSEERDGEYWIYVNKPDFTENPNAEYPIVQSYVDVFLSGCLELEEKYNITDFAGTCIETTKNWSSNWVNDRIYPRRPTLYEPRAARIDQLLAAKVPKQFGKIVIEG